jgi:hypothetical protein
MTWQADEEISANITFDELESILVIDVMVN